MKLWKTIIVLVTICVLVFLPVFLSSYYVGLMVLMLIFSIFAMSLDILLGYGGLPTLGHAAFFGVAAYTSGYLALKGVGNFWLQAASGIVLSLIVAAVFGFFVLRTRGVYFLMITLALSQLLWGISFKWTSVTHGEEGLPGIPRPDLVFIRLNTSDVAVYYYFTLVIFAAATVAMYLIVLSPYGLALKGTKDSETRMHALGYNVWLYQYVALIIAALFASIAGVLSAFYHGFVGPQDLHVATSAKVLFMVIFGGAGTLFGSIFGAFSIVLLENLVSSYTEHWLLVLGLIYVSVIIFAPRGIFLLIKEAALRWLRPQVR